MFTKDELKNLNDLSTKLSDAMETYSIRWIDLYSSAKGDSPYLWRHTYEIKANNVKEALEKLSKRIDLGGVGTNNCLVARVATSRLSYNIAGRLSELLKKTKEQLGDSVKDDWRSGELTKEDTLEWSKKMTDDAKRIQFSAKTIISKTTDQEVQKIVRNTMENIKQYFDARNFK